MLPTPAKFHYVFNMRDLSRIFQGILLTPKGTILTGGIKTPNPNQAGNLMSLWYHECARVFQDKMTNNPDKAKYTAMVDEVLKKAYGNELAKIAMEPQYYVSCLREDVLDPETGEVSALAPQIYEPGGSLEMLRDRIQEFATKYNIDFPAKQMNLVMFDDALGHLVRIMRIIGMPRGSALLVGVGGSGKQSLTRMSAYISRHICFQITLTKMYNTNALMEDLKKLYQQAGHKRNQVTFIFTDAEIKDENFLEFLNSILNTGEIPGLFAKVNGDFFKATQ
jgi:dynein heavy chain